jgi:hypothetical protein
MSISNLDLHSKNLTITLTAAAVILLLLLVILLRRKNRKQLFTNKSAALKTPLIPAQQPLMPDVPAIPVVTDVERYEVINLVAVTDPLEGDSALSKQINAVSNLKTESEIVGILRQVARLDVGLISQAISKWSESRGSAAVITVVSHSANSNGLAVKIEQEGKFASVLFGEVNAISRSTTAFHPEIISAIAEATGHNNPLRLMAVDGLVYLAVEVRLIS